ncbi:MAG TPA: isochorismatase family protein [Vicinamibacterales bacterium]|nr:isochorismatase family protein [Vicinamibacterales bacterium]
MTSREHSALLVVDVQNDFCTNGALAVPGSERVIEAINRHISHAVARGWPVYASRDWHPAQTTHFQQYGGQWPVHCVQDSPGARFHPDLHLPDDVMVVTKGDRADEPGYSAFEGRTPDGTALVDDLGRRGIAHLYVGGLATDYCVRASALDALDAGLRVTLLEDAVAGVDLTPGDAARALDELRGRGTELATTL